MEEEKEELSKLNKSFKKTIKTNNVSTRKVLFEKCIRGREMSDNFMRRTKAFYPDIHNTFDRKEFEMEDELIDLLEKINIAATKKSDKRSLPYNNVIISKNMLESDVSAMFDCRNIYRRIVSELLEKGLYKVRFYVHIENYDDDSNVMTRVFGISGIKYCFRYYTH